MRKNNTTNDNSTQSIIAVHPMAFEIYEKVFVNIMKLEEQAEEIV